MRYVNKSLSRTSLDDNFSGNRPYLMFSVFDLNQLAMGGHVGNIIKNG